MHEITGCRKKTVPFPAWLRRLHPRDEKCWMGAMALDDLGLSSTLSSRSPFKVLLGSTGKA